MLSIPRPNNLRQDQTQSTHEYLAANRILFLYGPIANYPSRNDVFNPAHISDMILVLSHMDSKSPIWLVIDSPGGDIHDGLMLYDAMKMATAPVYTVGRNCYSMATILLSGGAAGHRYVYPHSQTMLHLPMGGAMGDSTEMQIRSRELAKAKDLLVDILIENGARQTKKQILKDIDREHWMTAQETIDYGIADAIIQRGQLEGFAGVGTTDITGNVGGVPPVASGISTTTV